MKGKTAKLSGEQRKQIFWNAISSQTLGDLRETLANTAIEAHTRNEETQLTSIMTAAKHGKIKSLDTLLDWYERRRVLRPKGWIDLREDETGMTALMMAAGGGHVECAQSLLRYEANIALKDDAGRTARDIAVEKKRQAMVEFIDEYLRQPEEEDEGEAGEGADNVGPNGEQLTASQKRKLKKREKETGGLGVLGGEPGEKKKEEGSVVVVGGVDLTRRVKEPLPKWPEVVKLCESFDALRPLYELVVSRTDEAVATLDPAIWNLHWLKVLRVRLASPNFTSIEGKALAKLGELQQLILSGNTRLSSLPAEIGALRHLRVLELEGCAATRLPDEMKELHELESLNASNNALESLSNILPLPSLSILNVSGNRITSLEGFGLDTVPRLTVLMASRNKLSSLPPTLAALPTLATLEAEGNAIKELPLEFASLKKLKTLKLDGNPLADQKVVRMLHREGKGLKELMKYLEGLSVSNAKKGGKKDKKKQAVVEEEEEEEESDLDIDDDEL